MKKFLFLVFLSAAFTSCQDAVNNDYKLPAVLDNHLFHSLFHSSNRNNADSAKAANDKHFNFFLKEGIAKKFGL